MFEDDEDGPPLVDDADQKLFAWLSLSFLVAICAALYAYFVWKGKTNGPAL